MFKIFLVCLVLTIPISALSQGTPAIYSECIPIQYVFDNFIRVTPQGEIYVSQYEKLLKYDKHGTLTWKKDIEGSIQASRLDDLERVCISTTKYNSTADNFEVRFYRFDSNGKVDSAMFPHGSYDQVALDKFGNTYILTRGDNAVDPTYDVVFLSKYDLSGNLVRPVQTITDMSSKSGVREIKVNDAGEVFIVLKVNEIIADESVARSQIMKLDTEGNTLWSTPFEPDSEDESLLISPFIDSGGDLLVISRLFNQSPTTINSLSKINGQSGERGSSVPINSDVALSAVTFKNGLIYLATFDRIMVFSNDLSSLIDDFPIAGDEQMGPTSILVDPLGAIYLSGSGTVGINRAVLVHKYSNQKLNWKYISSSYSIGLSAFDFENNVLLLKEDCLIRIKECADIQIAIIDQPENIEGCAGDELTFEVNASGVNLAYFWYKDNETVQLSNSTKYDGTSTSILKIKQASISDIGTYYCVVQDACKKLLQTKNVTLSITTSPVITSGPTNVQECFGNEAVFEIVTEGGTNNEYQWKKGANALVDNPSIAGAKTNKLTLKGITLQDAGEYYCELKAHCFTSPIASQKALLSVLSKTTITNHPESVMSCVGNSVSFLVNASGTDLRYQWKKNGQNLFETSTIAGTSSNTLSLTELQLNDAGDYTCEVSGDCGESITSLKGVLMVATNEQIVDHPQPSSICHGSNTSFMITTTGAVLTYEWMKENTLLTNNTKYTGVNTATLSILGATTSEQGTYACVVTTVCGAKLISKSAQLNIAPTLSITSQSPDLDLCSGTLAEISVTTEGGSSTYRWMKDGIPLKDDKSIIGSTTAKLYIDNVTIAAEGNYACEVTPACGTPQVSKNIKVEVKDRVVITKEPVAQNLCEGEKLTLSISIQGFFPSYQWKLNGEDLKETVATGTKTETLTIHDVTLLNEGYYTCEVTGCSGINASTPTFIKVNRKPKLSMLPSIDCNNLSPQWSDLVKDENNTYGDFTLLKKGSSEALDLSAITHTGIYVIVKQTANCSDEIEWNNTCIITGSEDDLFLDVSVHPNPTDRWIQIRYPVQFKSFEIFDARGARKSEGTLPSEGETMVDVELFESGIYLVHFYNGSNASTFRRFIVKR